MLATGGRVNAQDTIHTRVFFGYDSQILEASACRRLDSLLAVVGSCPVRQLRITGNTDHKGSEDYNLQLSEQRAAAVMDYLASHGMAADHLEVLSQGKSLPLVHSEDEHAMAANRRVDVAMILWEENPPVAWMESPPAAQKPAGLQKFTGDIRVEYPESFSAGGEMPVPRMIGNVQEMMKLGYMTMSTGGEVLSPVALIRWTSPGSRDQLPEKDFSEALTVMVPFKKGSCTPETVKLWKAVCTGADRVLWVESDDSVALVKAKTGKYYSFRALTSGPLALMCRPQTRTLSFLVKDLSARKILLVYSRAKIIVSGTEVLPGYFEVPAPDVEEVPKLYASALAEGDETYEIRGMRLDECRHKPFSGSYILKKQDFRKRPPQKLKSVDRDEIIFGLIEQ